MDVQHLVVVCENREASKADLHVMESVHPAIPGLPSERLAGGVLGQGSANAFQRLGAKPPADGRKAPLEDATPKSPGRKSEANAEHVTGSWRPSAPEDAEVVAPVRGQEGLVPSHSGQKGSPGRSLEERSVEMSIAGPENPMASQDSSRHRSDAIELVRRVTPEPVLEPEVSDNSLLPLGFLGAFRSRKPVSGRYRQSQPLSAGEIRCHGQDGRGIATT
jgi:hypothetical protein